MSDVISKLFFRPREIFNVEPSPTFREHCRRAFIRDRIEEILNTRIGCFVGFENTPLVRAKMSRRIRKMLIAESIYFKHKYPRTFKK